MLAKVNTLQCNGGALKLKGAGHERGRRRCFDVGVVASALYAVGDDVTAQYNCSKAQPAVESKAPFSSENFWFLATVALSFYLAKIVQLWTI